MSKFLDTYDIVKCSRTDDGNISMIVKHKQNGSQSQFVYNPKEKTNDVLAQMLYDEFHNVTVVDDSNDKLENMAAQIRGTRCELLRNTDVFLAVPDYPITDNQREEVRIYRQALRDIPQQPGFPENVVWPEKPSCIS